MRWSTETWRSGLSSCYRTVTWYPTTCSSTPLLSWWTCVCVQPVCSTIFHLSLLSCWQIHLVTTVRLQNCSKTRGWEFDRVHSSCRLLNHLFCILWPCDLDHWPFDLILTGGQGIVMSSLVVLVSAILVLLCAHTHTHRSTDAAKRLSHATVVSMSNKDWLIFSVCFSHVTWLWWWLN